jgi:hypothetical protein
VAAGPRDRLERVCRYALRPPLSEERLAIDAQGQVVLQLRRPWANGTTTLVFEPTAFLERLAVLVPRPRINLVLYHGVLGARAAWRRDVVPGAAPSAPGDDTHDRPVRSVSLLRTMSFHPERERNSPHNFGVPTGSRSGVCSFRRRDYKIQGEIRTNIG